MARICRACKGSGWHGSRSALTESWGGKGSPCRACNGTGSDNRWSEKSCRKCYSTIEYRTDWSHVPDYCENCRKDQYKSCANPHCNGTVRYKVFWDHIPDYCQCKGWYTATCQNSHCGQQFQANCNWSDPPQYCKTCKGWFQKDCATRNCGGKVRVHFEWTHPPEYCETCKKLGGRNRDPWRDPRNRIEPWVNKETGQMNEKIVSGPDMGVHRYYDKKRQRSGQTGTERFWSPVLGATLLSSTQNKQITMKKIIVDYKITPENAEKFGLIWYQDYIYDSEAPEIVNRGLKREVECEKIVLGSSATPDGKINNMVGIYKKVVEEK